MAQISYDTFTITNIPDNLRQNFWVETTNYSSQIPAGVYITQNSANSFKNNPSGPNIFMQAASNNNGIRLRQGLLTLAEIMSDRFRLYTPNGSNQGLLGLSLDATDGLVLYKTNNAAVEKGLQLSSAGLELFGSSQSTADVTIDSGGINIGKGKIIGGEVGSSYVPQDDFLYLSTQNYGSYLNVADSGLRKNWRLVIGKYFGITEGGNAYLNGATITGKIIALTGQIGGTSVGDSWGWTLGLGRLYSGTMGSDNSLHMRTLNLGTNDEAVSINNCAPRKDWRFTVGSKFGVTSTGELFADGANLTNINAGSINIGPVVKYYVCDTEAATPAKTIDNVPNFTLTIGMVINVTFTYGNTNSQPTLNINNTGAKSIMKPSSSGATNLSYYEYNFATSNTVRTFRYDGTYWVLQDDGAGNARSSASSAATSATGYITSISGIDGITVHRDERPITNFVNIRDDGIHIYKKINTDFIDVAFFGESAIVGPVENDQSRVEITSGGINLISRSSNNIDSVLAHFGYAYNRDGTYGDGGTIEGSKTPFYILGYMPASTTQTYGKYSVSEGNSVAWGGYSHAEGFYTCAYGANSHSEGQYSLTQGSESHAEGYWTQALGTASHAEGYYSKTKQAYSHAQNQYTRAFKKAQTAIGTYNAEDKSNTTTHPSENAIYGQYAFIIGNGTGDGDAYRSNALAVAWNGNITVANHSSHIGDYKSHVPDAISCATGKYYQIAYLTLDPGVWMVDCVGHFPNTNTTGIRDIRVTTATSNYNNVTTAPEAYGNITIDRRTAANHVIFANSHFPVSITATTTFRLIAYQTSGQTVSVDGRMYAVRIQ